MIDTKSQERLMTKRLNPQMRVTDRGTYQIEYVYPKIRCRCFFQKFPRQSTTFIFRPDT